MKTYRIVQENSPEGKYPWFSVQQFYFGLWWGPAGSRCSELRRAFKTREKAQRAIDLHTGKIPRIEVAEKMTYGKAFRKALDGDGLKCPHGCKGHAALTFGLVSHLMQKHGYTEEEAWNKTSENEKETCQEKETQEEELRLRDTER